MKVLDASFPESIVIVNTCGVRRPQKMSPLFRPREEQGFSRESMEVGNLSSRGIEPDRAVAELFFALWGRLTKQGKRR
jgi:hypothetical protein